MSMPTVNTEQLLSPSQAAEIIGVTKRRVNQLCDEGKLGFRIGRLFFIPREQAKKFKRPPIGRPPKNGAEK